MSCYYYETLSNAQDVDQSRSSESPNYWIGYVSTAHQGGDTTKDHDPNWEETVLGQTYSNLNSPLNNTLGMGSHTAWVYVESTHDRYVSTGSVKVPLTAAHEMGHMCGLRDSVGVDLMKGSDGTGTLFSGQDVNRLRCRVISPQRNP